MNATLEKLISSRIKSISKLKARIAETESTIARCEVGSVARVALNAALSVDTARLGRLETELKGFRSASGQSEIPGSEAIPPKVSRK